MGLRWHRARRTSPAGGPWQRWEHDFTPAAAGGYELLARATDVTGAGQPDVAEYNTLGYLFGAVVRHPVTAVG